MDGTPPGHYSRVVPNAVAKAGVTSVAPRVRDAALTAPSFDDLYREYFDFVWRSARRLGVQPAQLDDAVQDVFIVVHRRLADYEPRHSPRSWLFAIAQRVASDHRRTFRRKGGHLPLHDSVPAPGADDPMETAVRSEAGDIILRFLDSLDEDRRATFILAELEQMTAPEISRVLAVNTSTIYSRIRSARQALVDYVTEHHPDALGDQDG